MLYGEGEFDDGFLGLCRGAWEGAPVPVFGDGSNVLPLCHAGNVAAVALELAAQTLNPDPTPAVPDAIDPDDVDDVNAVVVPRTLNLNPKTAIPPASGSLESRYVLAVDEDVPGATQISVAASIAREFDAPLVRFPASSLALSETALTPNLLTHAEFCSSDIARRAISANATRHRGVGARRWRLRIRRPRMSWTYIRMTKLMKRRGRRRGRLTGRRRGSRGGRGRRIPLGARAPAGRRRPRGHRRVHRAE